MEKENARCDAGAVLSADGPEAQCNRTTDEKQFARGKAECIRRLCEAMAEGRFDPVSADFRCVLRILRRSARNKWKPTPPQIRNMQRVVAELDENESLIDWGDTGYG